MDPREYHYEWPIITSETIAAVVKQLTLGEISYYKRQGVFEEFEDAFAASVNRSHGLVVSSGTAALHTAMFACGFGPGDEVLVPAYTFFATASPLFHTGAVPVMVDAGPDGNIDVAKLEAAITAKTKGVIVTHMWGMPCDMDAIMAVCEKYALRLIEDCSHAHGALYRGRPIGSFGDMSAYSLQGPKIVTGGEGGILLTSNDDLYYRSVLFGHYNKRALQEIPESSPLRTFAVTGAGLKLRAHPFAIAMALEQFGHLQQWHEAMNANAAYLSQQLRDVQGIQLPELRHVGDEPSWYAYVFRVTQPLRVSVNKFCQALVDEGVNNADMPGSTCPLDNLALFRVPSILFPGYTGLGGPSFGDFPVAQDFFRTAIKLPIAVDTSREYREVLDYYADTICRTLSRFAV